MVEITEEKLARLVAMPRNILFLAQSQRIAAEEAATSDEPVDELLHHYLMGKVDANESTACYVTQELKHAGLLPKTKGE